MKVFTKVLFLTAILSSNLSFALTMKDLKGAYEVTAQDVPVKNIVTLAENGSVNLQEKSLYGDLNCTGRATLEKNILSVKVKCTNGQSFEERVNLKNVSSNASFKAPVYSTLYGVELEMNFKKIK